MSKTLFWKIFAVDLRNGSLLPGIFVGVVLFSFLSNFWGSNYGSLPILVIRVSSIKDGDVGNLRKIEYVYNYV